MKRLISYFIKYPVAANILIIMIISMGILGLQSLNSTLVPQVDPGRIIVTASYPGASPEEIEQGIILKIEDNLKGISGIDEITSQSFENSGVVNISLDAGEDADVVLQDVKNAVDGISSFPAGMEPANVKKVEFLAPAVFFAINGDVDLRELKEYAREIEDNLRGIEGISKVELAGFPDEEIEISFREKDLLAYNMTFQEAYNAVKGANIDLTGGTIRGKSEELFIRTKQKKYYAEDMRNIVLRSSADGAVVRLSDVATIQDKWEETPNKTLLNGKPSISIIVRHTTREDIIHISNEIKKYVEEFNAGHKVVRAQINYDLSVEIDSMQSILLNNGIMGFILVLLFLSLFLNYRLSFWVAASIPLSFLGMFLVANFYGLTLNKMSLFGMILVIGILVDDGIVISENIYRHYEEGKSRLQAAVDGAMEVLPAVFSAVLTTVAAFLAFFFIEGVFGQFMVEMAFVVIAALLFSLIEGAFILPAHVAHSKALDKNVKKSKFETAANNWLVNIRDKYFQPMLRWSINHKFLTLLLPVSALIITYGAYYGGIIKSGDSSVRSRDFVQISLEMPSGTPESVTFNHLLELEDAVWKTADELNAKRNDSLKIVTSVQVNQTASNAGMLRVFLLEGEKRNMRSGDFSNAVRKNAGTIKDAERLNFVQESHFGKPVSVSLQSLDLEELDSARTELKAELNKLTGLKNVVDDYETGMREIEITLKEKAYPLGLTLQDVMNQVRYGFFGLEIQRINRGLDLVKVWVRYDKSDRASIGKLENMRIRTGDQSAYPLREIANMKYERNLTSINHYNGKRAVRIEADLLNQDVNLSEIKEEINNNILPALKSKYPGIKEIHGGHSREMEKALGSFLEVIPMILILLLVIITFTFRSFLQTMLVFALIPFGLIGIGWGHAIHSYAIDMPSYFGLIALMGVMINDAIVLISRVNDLLREGKDYAAAVFEATVSRFRPIVLTSLTTIAGLMPLIFSGNTHAEMVVPMAISLAYGLIVSTFLTLAVLPALMTATNNLKVYIRYRMTGVRPDPREVEQAVIELNAVVE